MPTTILERSRAAWTHAQQRTQFGSFFALTFAVNLLLAGLALVSGVLVARALGPAGRGELAAIQTWPTFLAGFAMLGVPEALVYYSARQPERARQWLTTAILTALIATVPIAALGYIAMPWLLAVQSQAVIQGARFYLWLLPLYATAGMLIQPLRGVNDLVAWNALRIFPAIGWIVVLLIVIMAGTITPNLLAIGYLVSLTLVAMPTGFVVLHRLRGILAPSRLLVPPLIRYGLPTVLARVPATINLRVDQLVMAAWLDPKLLGFYVVGVSWSTAVTPLIGAMSQTLLPRIAGVSLVEQQRDLLGQGMRLGFLLSVLSAAFVALLTPAAITLLFGSGYTAAIPAATILALSAGVDGYKQILGAGAMSFGLPRLILFAELAGLVATVILLAILLVPFQIVGAAVASLVSYCIVCVVLVFTLAQKVNVAWYRLVVPDRSDFRSTINKLRGLLAWHS